LGRPAILGGKPVCEKPIPFWSPSIIEQQDRVIRDFRRVLRSGRLVNGDFVRRLEERIASYLGVHNVVAVSSATSGLVLTLRLLLCGRPRNVLLPSFTFSPVGDSVLLAGGHPVFVDIQADTLNLDLDDLKSKMSEEVGCIVATHTFGNPCSIDQILNVAKRQRVPVVFDASHAFGSRYRGQLVGRFGIAEIFSLDAVKILCGMKGGLVVTYDERLAEMLRLARNYGNSPEGKHLVCGLNAKMPEVCAVAALASLSAVGDHILSRKAIAEDYLEGLGSLPGLQFQSIENGNTTNFQFFAIQVEERTFGVSAESLVKALAAEKIESRRYFCPPLHLSPVFSSGHVKLRMTEEVCRKLVCLPIFDGMKRKMVKRVCSAVSRMHEYAEELRNYQNVKGHE